MLFGADRIREERKLFAGRVALLTAPSGRTMENRSTVDCLAEVCDLKLLLAPEHGVRGDQPAGALFLDSVDEESGLPTVSLYAGPSKRLADETLSRFDTLVYDVQDVGCRYYTFISSLKNVLEDCARAGKRLVVLDRPNPLGDGVEGCRLDPDMSSFVGCYPMPVKYGLTCGEFASMVNDEEGLRCDLHVVLCRGLSRETRFSGWRRPWIMPSLAMPRYETAALYPGACLIEGTNCSEGRGTADPFAILGAPFIKAESFARRFNSLGLAGVLATPVFFTPAASKHAGVLCGGLHLHVTDEAALRPFAMGIRLLDLLRTEYPTDFAFLPPVKEGGRPFISLLMGNGAMESPDWSPEKLLDQADADREAFLQRKRRYHLY